MNSSVDWVLLLHIRMLLLTHDRLRRSRWSISHRSSSIKFSLLRVVSISHVLLRYLTHIALIIGCRSGSSHLLVAKTTFIAVSLLSSPPSYDTDTDYDQ